MLGISQITSYKFSLQPEYQKTNKELWKQIYGKINHFPRGGDIGPAYSTQGGTQQNPTNFDGTIRILAGLAP